MFQKIDKTQYENDRAMFHYFNTLLNIGTSIFKWEGLPKEIDTRFLEYNLTLYGKMLFFKSTETDDWTVAQFSFAGMPSRYNVPYDRIAYFPNDSNEDYTADNSIVIFNNMSRYGDLQAIDYYAQRLANVSRTIDVNIDTQKMPYILKMDDKTKLSVANIFKKILNNVVAVATKKSFSQDSIEVLNLDTKFIANDLTIQKQYIFTEFFNYFGIDSFVSTKKERSVSGEVDTNKTSVGYQGLGRLKERQRAAEEISKMIGNEVTVQYDMETIENGNMFYETGGGEIENNNETTGNNDGVL